ncbi:AAA family ATPase [Corynebacterium variabile]|uniref:AAA family ATPase n=1 Tax=Corynebacterium variabile TaxID=1727 RepID=UPI003FD10049
MCARIVVATTDIVAFIHSKGGVGKSTLTLFTALALVERGLTVQVLDADPQASLAHWSHAADRAGEPLAVHIGSTPSPRFLHEAVTAAREAEADVVLIDTPPGTPDVLDAAVTVIDLALVPTAASPMDIDRVWPTLDLLAGIPTAVVLNALDAREAAATVAKSTLESAGVTVADTTIPMRASVRRAFGTNPTPVPAVYRELADEIQEAVS